MATRDASEAPATLQDRNDHDKQYRRPATLGGERGNVARIVENDRPSISDTLFLLSIPRMQESIREGMEARLKDCANELDW